MVSINPRLRVRKETFDIDILITSRSDDRKITQHSVQRVFIPLILKWPTPFIKNNQPAIYIDILITSRSDDRKITQHSVQRVFIPLILKWPTPFIKNNQPAMMIIEIGPPFHHSITQIWVIWFYKNFILSLWWSVYLLKLVSAIFY